jgi:hypothetical protein
MGVFRWTNPNGGQNGGQTHSQTKRIEGFEPAGMTPPPATWPASALVNSTDGSVSARTQRSAASLVIGRFTPRTPANLTASTTTKGSCTKVETGCPD